MSAYDELADTLSDVAAALAAVADVMATDSRDWSRARGDAWLYGVLVGWDCEEDHDHGAAECEGGALDEVATGHGWTAAHRARLRTLRRAVRAATEGTDTRSRGAAETETP